MSQYDTCAAAIRQHISFKPSGTSPHSSYGKPYFPCYLNFAMEIARLMDEAPDVGSCTYEYLIEQMSVKNLVNMDLSNSWDVKDVQAHIGRLLEAMTLMPWKYNFVRCRMRCNSTREVFRSRKAPGNSWNSLDYSRGTPRTQIKATLRYSRLSFCM